MESHEEKNIHNGRLIMGVCLLLFISIVSCSSVLASERDDLIKAIRAGEIGLVKSLIEQKVDLNARDNSGKTPLMIAAFHNKPQIVQILIENGAKLEATEDVFRRTALLLAAARKHIDIIKIFPAFRNRGNASCFKRNIDK